MASVTFVSKAKVQGSAHQWMFTYQAMYHFGRYSYGGTYVVGPWSNENEAREDALAQANDYEANNDPRVPK